MVLPPSKIGFLKALDLFLQAQRFMTTGGKVLLANQRYIVLLFNLVQKYYPSG